MPVSADLLKHKGYIETVLFAQSYGYNVPLTWELHEAELKGSTAVVKYIQQTDLTL